MSDKDEIIKALLEENAVLRQEIAELKKRFGLDSSTSSKPPSSDGPGKRPADLLFHCAAAISLMEDKLVISARRSSL